MSPARHPVDSLAAVNEVLADLGSLVRRVQAESLDQAAFYELTGRMRRRLKALRIDLSPEPEIELTDLGAAIGRMIDAGLITPASELLPGLNRARTYGHLAVIDGDRAAERPNPQNQGA